MNMQVIIHLLVCIFFPLHKVYGPIFYLNKSTKYCSMLFILLIILHAVFDHDLRDALNYFKHML